MSLSYSDQIKFQNYMEFLLKSFLQDVLDKFLITYGKDLKELCSYANSRAAWQEGKEEGYEEGYEKGYADGYEKGRKEVTGD